MIVMFFSVESKYVGNFSIVMAGALHFLPGSTGHFAEWEDMRLAGINADEDAAAWFGEKYPGAAGP